MLECLSNFSNSSEDVESACAIMRSWHCDGLTSRVLFDIVCSTLKSHQHEIMPQAYIEQTFISWAHNFAA